MSLNVSTVYDESDISNNNESDIEIDDEEQRYYESYSEYLQSSHWRKVREQRKAYDEYKCYLCGSTDELNVHHISYKNLGRENINNDLVTLCRDCHQLVHRIIDNNDYFAECKKHMNESFYNLQQKQKEVDICAENFRQQIIKNTILELWANFRKKHDLFHNNTCGYRIADIINMTLEDRNCHIKIEKESINKAVNFLKDFSIMNLHDDGWANSNIAMKMGLSENIVYKRLKQYEFLKHENGPAAADEADYDLFNIYPLERTDT